MKLRRRKLLLTGLAALAIVVAADGLASALRVEYWRPDERFWRVNVYAYQRARLASDVLVVGSSRILFGVSAVRLERELAAAPGSPSVYNLGQAFGNALKNVVILRDVLRSNGCPQIVLLEVSPSLVNGGLEQRRFIAEFATLADLPLLAPELRSKAQLDAYLTSLLAGPVALYYHWTDPPTPAMVEGALERQGSRWGERPPQRLKRLGDELVRQRGDQARQALLERFLADFTISGVPARALDEIAGMVEGCGTRLLLVRLPSLVPSAHEIEAIDRSFQDYVSDFSRRTGIPYYDVRAADVGLRPEHFHDFSHLNHAGAERLSRYLAREILLPELEGRATP